MTATTDPAENLTHPKYRTDIDGLRAIAVLAVVGFHAFPGWVRGGFIGVDVFFVISGFLISTIIFGSLQRARFSFAEFYSRRIRRIFPALLLILSAVGVFGWFALYADEYRQLGKHIAGGTAFIFNFLVWNESGYFDSSADRKPLLHLWSLGIEEQFYIFWPLILWISWKRRFNLISITLAVTCLSFALNVFSISRDVTAAFYSPLTRFWELSVGSMLAYVTLLHERSPVKIPFINLDVQSALGAGLLALGIALITRQKEFPGWWAALPTLGTALMISAGMGAAFNRRVLSNRVLVGIGLISYPLYLWHWPLLSFARILEGLTPAPVIRVVCVAVAAALAWLTYQFVEKPFRSGTRGRAKTISLFAAMTLVCALGLAGFLENGWPARMRINPASGASLFEPNPHEPFHDRDCDRLFPMFKNFSACLLSRAAPPDVLLLADSHSNHFYKSLARRLNDHVVLNVVQWSCLPFSSQTHQAHDQCSEKFDAALKFMTGSSSIKTIYLAGYWTYLAAGGYGPERDGWRLPRPIATDELDSFEKHAAQVLSALSASGKHVVLMLDVPDLTFSPRSCVAVDGSSLIKYRSQGASNDPNACLISTQSYQSRVSEFDAAFSRTLAKFPEVSVYSPRPLFCDQEYCRAEKDGVFLYYSCDHLTIAGADRVVDDLVKQYPPATDNRAH